MKAAYLEQTGAASVIRYGDLPTPEPKPGEVRVKVAVAALNPIDVYIRSGQVKVDLPMPFITGTDLAGTVEAVGVGVIRFHVGDRVWGSNQGLLGRQGTFAEFSCVAEDYLYPLPNGVAEQDAAAIALVGNDDKVAIDNGCHTTVSVPVWVEVGPRIVTNPSAPTGRSVFQPLPAMTISGDGVGKQAGTYGIAGDPGRYPDRVAPAPHVLGDFQKPAPWVLLQIKKELFPFNLNFFAKDRRFHKKSLPRAALQCVGLKNQGAEDTLPALSRKKNAHFQRGSKNASSAPPNQPSLFAEYGSPNAVVSDSQETCPSHQATPAEALCRK